MVMRISKVTAICMLSMVLSGICHVNAQTSRILQWQDEDFSQFSPSTSAYHPEPIIFVHGITSSRRNWEDVIQYLGITNHWYDAYHYVFDAYELTKESTATNVPAEEYTSSQFGATFVPDKELDQWKDIERPYLHTFNYGRHAYRGPAPVYANTHMLRQSRQTHDPVEWNSWVTPANDYLSGRTTLRDRIEREITGVRAAYSMPNQEPPNVILIGHSLGGLLICDYLQRRNADLQGQPYVPVRRAITIDSVLWGSPIASLLVNFKNLPRAGHGGMLWLNVLGPLVMPVADTAPNLLNSKEWKNATGTWLENYNGSSRYLAMDLSNAVARGNMPAPGSKGVLFTNSPFQARLHSTLMPETTEFVTSGAKAKKKPFPRFAVGPTLRNDLDAAFSGDGAVPLHSMAGYNGDGTSVFTNISPVDIRGYLYTNVIGVATNWIADHGSSIHQHAIYPHLLDGVQYITGPRDERPGGWSGLQKQYPNAPIQTASGTTFTHTDEPGIAALHLLYIRTPTENPTRIPSLDTWIISNGVPQKIPVADQRFDGRQIIGRSTDQSLAVLGMAGTKNRSQNPVGILGTNYWVAAGNEYLPASLAIQFRSDLTPLLIATSTNALSMASRIVTNCLVQLDANDEPEFQYGFFHTNGVSIVNARTNYIAAQGFNLAGLLTPQAERAFDVPVVSSDVVSILRGINLREAMTTNCLVATEPTRWAARVDEWVNVNTNTLQFALNFFPTNFPSVATNNIVRDAWTGTPYTDWVYVESNKTVVITNATTASSQFLVSYDAFLGTATGFTNVYSGSVTNFFVLALQDDTLAGVPATMGLLGQIRTALDAVIPKFLDPATTNCVPWTKTNLVARLYPGVQPPPTDWLPVDTGLITAAHFQEMQDALDLLNLPADCACGGGIGDPMCGGQSDASGDCGLCTDCVPPSMTVVVTGGSVAGTYVLPYTQCGDPQFGGGVA